MKKISLLLLLAAMMCSPVLAEWQMKKANLMTRWADEVNVDNPFPDYPRPQMERGEWLNLNGLWQFEGGKLNDRIPFNRELSEEILVPFAMESAISGVMKHYERSWYRRTFDVPAKWSGKNILLHLDAVDWESEIFVNGESVTVHKGGYDPIILDITKYLANSGSQELIVRVYDPTDNKGYARGKQTLHTGGIMYTSVSGIWQSVWLEPVDANGINNLKMTPDIDKSELNLKVNTFTNRGQEVDIKVSSKGKTVTTFSGKANADLAIKIPNQKLWSPESPFLYDMTVTVKKDGKVIDSVNSYFGMRKMSLGREDGVLKMFLNNEFVFQMGPLDQGWWPDGLYTAPTDDALKYDIIKTKEFGFNMTRKHIKVEPARWYYWADKLGLMVWQDMPSTNSYTPHQQPIDAPQFELELNRMIDNLWNSPSIISWVVFNERQGRHDVDYLVDMVKRKDPSRLVNQDSGAGFAEVGDVYDVHSYPPPAYPNPNDEAVNRMARACGEYGGIGYIYEGHLWNPDRDIMEYSSITNDKDFFFRYNMYNNSLLEYKVNQGLSAAVYTEITDVENETNGLITYDRIVKVDEKRVAELNNLVINGDLKVKKVLANSSVEAAEWSYTTKKPAADWYKPGADVSGWKTGKGGFGATNTPNSTVRTEWNTSDIWIRRDFDMGSFSAKDISMMCFNIFYDEDYEIYINGVLAGSGKGFTTSYTTTEMTKEGRAALKTNSKNTIAIHCHQTMGGQFIDAGIMVYDVIKP